MNDIKKVEEIQSQLREEMPVYQAPTVRIMSETEVLSAFQVTAAGTSTWWTC